MTFNAFFRSSCTRASHACKWMQKDDASSIKLIFISSARVIDIVIFNNAMTAM
jgi:hypothetical protein